jgi:arginyl-tRNA synthetase
VTSLLKRAGLEGIAPTTTPIALEAAEERALALKLLQFSEALTAVTLEAWPHLMCAYLYELAGLLMRFYESCPVLKDDVPTELRESRLALAAVTGRTLRQGLELLGIEVPERM